MVVNQDLNGITMSKNALRDTVLFSLIIIIQKVYNYNNILFHPVFDVCSE